MPINPAALTRAREIVASGRNDRKKWLDALIRRFIHLDEMLMLHVGNSYDAVERAALAWAICELAPATYGDQMNADRQIP